MTLTLTLAQVYAYSEMEQMVRECTCNDAQTPSEMLMREIAKGTFTVEFSAISARRRPPPAAAASQRQQHQHHLH